MTGATSSFETRAATPADMPEIVSVCSAALGWKSPDFDAELFRWKHIDNAFGPSLMLLAIDLNNEPGHQIQAVRPFMRWRFRQPDGSTVSAARAVDTSTLPSAQGQGLFRRLTLEGLDALESEGCEFVFNTPNSKSLAGYLKMGWVEQGGVPFGFSLGSVGAAPRLAASRVPADKLSIPTPDLGVGVEEALSTLSESLGLAGLLHPHTLHLHTLHPDALRTDHTIDTLKWRYTGGPIVYRFIRAGAGSGLIVRLRQRGKVRELVLAQIIGDLGASTIAEHLRSAMDHVDADVCITPAGLKRTVTLARLGPTLAIRPLGETVSGNDLAWAPGDIELF